MAAISPERLARFEALHLAYGSHRSCDDGMCAVEAVNFLREAKHSDNHESNVIARFMISLNDRLPDSKRDLLKPLVLEIAQANGSLDVGRAAERKRAFIAVNFLYRETTPSLLNLIGLKDEAKAMRELPEVDSWDAVRAARPMFVEAREKARKIRDERWSKRADAAYADAAYAAYADAAAAAAAAAAADAAYAAYAAADAAYAAAAYAAAAYAAAAYAADVVRSTTSARLVEQAIECARKMLRVTA